MTTSEMDIQSHEDAARRGHGPAEMAEHPHKALVEVYIDDIPKEIPRGTYTTEELLKLLDVKPGYLLNLLDEKGQLKPLEPGEQVHVNQGMRFYSQAPGGGSA
jgi:hypothetical protein